MTSRRSKAAPSNFGSAELDIANRLFFRLYQASNLMHKTGTRFMSEFDSTTQQWAVLGALAGSADRSRGMTVKDLIEFLLLSRQNLTAVLDRLEAKDWVERVRDEEDGRSRRVRLTKEGEKIWSRMQPKIAEFYEAGLEGFSLEDRLTLFRLLDRLKDKLKPL